MIILQPSRNYEATTNWHNSAEIKNLQLRQESAMRAFNRRAPRQTLFLYAFQRSIYCNFFAKHESTFSPSYAVRKYFRFFAGFFDLVAMYFSHKSSFIG
jgi:hypothetical protein